MSGLSRAVFDSAVSESQARDLSITSPTLYKLLCDAVRDTIFQEIFTENYVRSEGNCLKADRIVHLTDSYM